MRRAGRIDNNQVAIVKAFRDIGATVQVLSAVGKGCPDTLIGFRGRNILVEIKNGEASKSDQEMTAAQRDWHASWAGQRCVATSIEDALLQVIEACR